MGILKRLAWARILSRYGYMSFWKAYKHTKSYMHWAYFEMALAKIKESDKQE